jgi:hypothetical protein
MHDRLRPSALARLLGETMAPEPGMPKLPKRLTAAGQQAWDRWQRDHPNAHTISFKKRKATPEELAAVTKRIGR